MIDCEATGFMLLADIEKAFDKLEWSYMFQALKYFNFGDDLISWVQILYTEICSCVVNNGHASEFFNLTRGVRQGCPLSPLLFIICNEIMSIWIKRDDNVKGITINDVEIKISMYADDTTFYVEDANSLVRIMYIIDQLKKLSGLCMNRNKSEIIALGYYKAHPPDVSFLGFTYSTGPYRLLGIRFSTNSNDLFELNFKPKLESLKRNLGVWAPRNLTPIGKITLVKSLGISQLVFLFSVLPKPPDTFIKEIESMIYSFIWSKKPDKISRKTIIGDYSEGGLKITHVQSVITGLKIAWVKRLLNSDSKGSWKSFFELSMKDLGGKLFWICNLDCKDKTKQVRNTFIREIFVCWSNLVFSQNPPERYIHNQVIWNNSCIRINGNVTVKHKWINKDVIRIHHLLNEQGTFLTHSQFKNKYEIQCNFLDFFSIISAIPLQWKRVVRNPQIQN